jgi:hypothetical protein
VRSVAAPGYDNSAVAIVDPYFDLSGLPDGVTFEISNGIGNALPSATPIPAALPLFASGLGALGLLGWRRKKKAAALQHPGSFRGQSGPAMLTATQG